MFSNKLILCSSVYVIGSFSNCLPMSTKQRRSRAHPHQWCQGWNDQQFIDLFLGVNITKDLTETLHRIEGLSSLILLKVQVVSHECQHHLNLLQKHNWEPAGGLHTVWYGDQLGTGRGDSDVLPLRTSITPSIIKDHSHTTHCYSIIFSLSCLSNFFSS